jgi:ABC-type branched-subunit amino acid transport system ATPase component
MSLLVVDGLWKRFGGIEAVRGCSFAVPQGRITGLIGPNGSGKTTVFNLITALLKPDAGEVRFRGRLLTTLRPEQAFALGIGRTFQVARIFPRLTVLENVLVPMRRLGVRALSAPAAAGSTQRKALDLLHFVALADHAGETAGNLSYGQRKLLELATVLMGDPDLILLDEPAGGVNPGLLERIEARVRDLNQQGRTFLIVEHNMGTVMRLCHHIVVLHRGTRIAEGDPPAIRRDPAVLEAYLGG